MEDERQGKCQAELPITRLRYGALAQEAQEKPYPQQQVREGEAHHPTEVGVPAENAGENQRDRDQRRGDGYAHREGEVLLRFLAEYEAHTEQGDHKRSEALQHHGHDE